LSEPLNQPLNCSHNEKQDTHRMKMLSRPTR